MRDKTTSVTQIAKSKRNFCTAVILSLLFAFVAGPPAYASISVTTDNASHASVHFGGTISAGCYQIRVGLSSGSYSPPTSEPVCQTTVAMAMGGLDCNTTYHYVMDRYANITDMSPAETSADATFATTACPGTHPQPPDAANTWMPTHPDTSLYTVVSIVLDGSNHPVSAQAYTNPGNWTGNIANGEALCTLIPKLNVGTAVEFAQGTTYKLTETESTFHAGCQLPATVDALDGRYLVFRTHSAAATDFPPFGVRTGPDWAAKMAKIEVQTPGWLNQNNNATGQVFQCYNTNCQHIWIENLEFTVNASYATPNSVDPAPFGCFIQILPLTASPHHIVLDRLYMHVETPQRSGCGIQPGGENFAALGTYISLDFWLTGLWPQSTVTASGSTVTVPAGETWKYNALSGSTYGTASQSTVTVAGTGTLTGWLDSASPGTNGLTVGYTGLSGAPTFGGGGGTAVLNGTPPATAFPLFTATVSTGTATITNSFTSALPLYATAYSPWKPLGWFLSSGDNELFDNNYLRAHGQTIYIDPYSTVTAADYTFKRNYLDFPTSFMSASPDWDGYARTTRNVLESKLGVRWDIGGNIINGAASYQNSGSPIMVVGSFGNDGAQGASGTTDFNIHDNIIRHAPAGPTVFGGGSNAPPDSPTAKRIKFANNLLEDINRDVYAMGVGQSFNSCYFSLNPGSEDLIIDHNTGMFIEGIGPCLLEYGGAGLGQTVLAEGLGFTNNLLMMTKRQWATQLVCLTNGTYANHPPSPAIDCSTGTLENQMGTFWMRNGTPNLSLTTNYFIGGYKCTANCNLGDANPTYAEMDAADVGTYSTGFPSGNTFPANSTLAARQAAIGWNATTYSASGCGGCGADVTVLPAAQGTVLNIAPGTPTSTTESVTYTSPDTGACYLETATDSGFTANLSRFTGSSGSTSASASATGLTPSTSYYGRILCHYEQTAAMEFSGTSLTTFTFTTASGIAGSTFSGKVSASGKVTIH